LALRCNEHVALLQRVEAGVRSVGVVRLDRRVLLVRALRLAANVQPTVDIADFQHLATQITLGASQSNDVTRILPPSSRLNASVVLSVVPRRSSLIGFCRR
jgi:hypothetical protein